VEIEKLLKYVVENGASDLFISAGIPPSVKLNGKLAPLTKNPLSPEETRQTVLGVMTETQRKDFKENRECNFAISARYWTIPGKCFLSAKFGRYGIASY